MGNAMKIVYHSSEFDGSAPILKTSEGRVIERQAQSCQAKSKLGEPCTLDNIHTHLGLPHLTRDLVKF